MSTAGNVQQLQQDLQNELTTANQLLSLISLEVKKIISFTNPGGELEKNIKENANLVTILANMQQIDISNLPPLQRTREIDGLDRSHQTDQHMSYNQHDSFRNTMDDSQ